MGKSDGYKKIKEEKTSVRRGTEGWYANTVRTEKGHTYDITTQKGYDGVMTTAYEVEKARDGKGFTVTRHLNMQPFFKVKHGKIRLTEKTVKELHYKALADFDSKIESGELKLKTKTMPEVGDILFLDGHGKTKG